MNQQGVFAINYPLMRSFFRRTKSTVYYFSDGEHRWFDRSKIIKLKKKKTEIIILLLLLQWKFYLFQKHRFA
jgi:hypothetical protein